MDSVFTTDHLLDADKRSQLTEDVLTGLTGTMDALSDWHSSTTYLSCIELLHLYSPGVLSSDQADAFWTVLVGAISEQANKRQFYLGQSQGPCFEDIAMLTEKMPSSLP